MTEADLDRFRAADVGIVLQGAARNLLPYLTARQNVEFAQQSAGRPVARCHLPARCSSSWGSTTPRPRRSTHCPPASSSSRRSRWRWRAGPDCCSATSRPLSCTTRPATSCSTPSTASTQEWGTTVVVVTHDPEVAARLPRTVTIRDGRVGGEGRSGEEYAVVSADGSLPLPAAAVDAFPPGALVRVHQVDGVWTLIPQGRVRPVSDVDRDAARDLERGRHRGRRRGRDLPIGDRPRP